MSAKTCIYIHRSQNQAETLFRSINPPPEYSGSSVRSIYRGRSSGIPIKKMWTAFTTLLFELNKRPRSNFLSWKQPEIARSQIRTIRRVLQYVEMLAGQPSFHNFGIVWSRVNVVQDSSMLQLRPLHSNMPLQLLQYPTIIHRIDFLILGDCVLINGSLIVEKNHHVHLPC